MKFILATLVTIFTSVTFAYPAATLSCMGKDSVSQDAVVFEVLFSNSMPELGYTNESITIQKKGFETLENPVVFQMHGATKANHCTKNEAGEIYLLKGFDQTPTPDGDIADFKVTVKSDCEALKLELRAYCFVQ